jgi:imidazolonepropionase-like amidohydrolase
MEKLIVRFGTLHDNVGEPRRNGVLVIEGDRIAEIGERVAGADKTDGTRVLEGACIVPGLINAHAHLEMSGEAQTTSVFVLTTPTQRTMTCAENASKSLRAGVTTIREIGGTENIAMDLRDAIDAGRLPGPKIVAAGQPICMTGGHGWWAGRQADGPWDVCKAVREQRRGGADCIKFIATGGVLTKGAVPGIEQLTEDEMRAGIDEAHKHGMHCAAHAIGTSGIKNAIRAGIDSIEHGHLIDEEGIRLMVERGTSLVPTLSAIMCIIEAGPDAGMPDFVTRKAREILEHAEGNLRKARAAGVKFAGGSDAGTPFNYHDAYWRELELMQSMLGMNAREALFAASASAADLLGVKRGRLQEGEIADLLLLDHDIDSDARAFRDPTVVITNGRIAADRRTA